MERLFSPWRSQYIASFSDKTRKDDACIFCAAVKEKKDARNLILLRRKYCFVMMNLYPYNSGHLMIIPYTHTAELSTLSAKEHADIMTTTSLAIDALAATMKPHGFNFGSNFGRVAGAGIDQHLHFHVVPRWNGDTNFMPTLADTRVVSESILATYKRLKRNFVKK